MTSPVAALKEAIQARLSADAAVLALLRDAKVYLDPPRNVAFPYMAFMEATLRDNGTSSEDGHVTELTLVIWSRSNGSTEGLVIADAVALSLSSGPLTATGHRVVNLVVVSIQPQPQKDTDTWRTIVRLRIVTEVI